MVRSTLFFVAQLALWAALSPAAAQTLTSGVGTDSSSAPMDGNAIDALARQQRIAITGTLGFPPLPAITPDSPRNSIFYADRLPYGAQLNGGGKIAATLTGATIPKAYTGTGFNEVIQYQMPDGYDEFGTPHPMVIAYHGYGGSATSPAAQSQLDEEANTRNWVYLSVTGLDDQLFGTPISQQNTRAAITWMMDNFNVDPDRLYMVGFSAGAAISANFAARHRDPDDVMIAALGLVSATGDWTMEYNLGDPSLQAWMENIYNFDGPPTTELFGYQSASIMFNETNSYPPVANAVPSSLQSMSTNLGSLPIYLTYDDQDTLPQVPILCEQLAATQLSVGGTLVKTVVSGTVLPGPPSVPAPHSWAVLDEVALFDFLDGKTVDRTPPNFSAKQDLGGPVSWASTVQERLDQFVRLDATVNTGLSLINITTLANANELHVDVGAAGLTGPMPHRVKIANVSQGTVRVHLTGFPDSPSYMKVPVVGSLITLVDSDPTGGPTGNGTLIVDVPGQTTFDGKIIHDPLWQTVLTTTPNPVVIGTPIILSIDAPAGNTNAWLVVSLTEMLTPVNNIIMTAFPGPPAIIRFLPLDFDGNISLGQNIPNDPILLGTRFPTQTVTTDLVGNLQTVSNLWGLYISP